MDGVHFHANIISYETYQSHIKSRDSETTNLIDIKVIHMLPPTVDLKKCQYNSFQHKSSFNLTRRAVPRGNTHSPHSLSARDRMTYLAASMQ